MTTLTRPRDPVRGRTAPVQVPLGHRPGLDGLRSIAVIGVIAFHSGFDWARGGYLGVSAFFTLSGFLITTLLLQERARTGRLDFQAFWARRYRRLLPAALVGVALAGAFVVAVGDTTMADRFRGDALATLGYVANWRFVFSDLSYADLFAGESPLQHMWSLAIEEQFYLVLPVVAALAFRTGRTTRRLALVAGTGIALSVLVTVLLANGADDRLYYGTDSRATELLIGVLLACAHHHWNLLANRWQRVRTRVGALCFGGLLAMWALVAQGSTWLYPWGLLLHAVLTAGLILSACDGLGVGRLLATSPMAALGRISYGVYVFHWPIFLWASPARTGLATVPLLVLRCGLTLALAVVSYQLVEMPVRRRTITFAGRGPLVAVASIAAAAVAVVVVAGSVQRGPAVDLAGAQELVEGLPSVAVASPTDATAPDTGATPDGDATGTWSPPSDRLPRVGVFGDSTALMDIPGLVTWSEQNGGMQVVQGNTRLGCSIGTDGSRLSAGIWEPIPEACDRQTWIPMLDSGRPDVVIIQSGLWDVVDRRLPGSDEEIAIGDPTYDAYLREELRAASDLALTYADRVVWILQAAPVRSTRDRDDPVYERLPRFNALLVDLFEDDPRIGLVDVDAWMRETGQLDSTALRPDGTHYSEATSADAATWIGPAVLAAAETGAVIEPDDVEAVPLRPES